MKVTYADGSYVEYTYDANGNLISVHTVNKTEKPSSTNNPDSDSDKGNSGDKDNEGNKGNSGDNDNGGNKGDITYEYDAEGNRIATNTPEYREEYIYDTVSNLPQVLVIKRYDVKDDESSSIVCYYGNGLLYEDNDKGTYYHHYNNIGSTILLTNSSGKIVEEYSYGTYGELLSGDTSKTKYLYNGQYGIHTEINGLLYMQTRYYNPEIKRFIN